MQKEDLLQNLQMDLGIYDSILFMPYTLQEDVVVSYICFRKHLKKKIMFFGKNIMGLLNNIDYTNLDEERSNDLKHLYHTYEFSNKFMMLSLNCNFGTIWNYVKTGFLTPEEALAALLD